MSQSLEFDTFEWRAQRDELLLSWVQDIHAVRLIVLLGETAEVWDDLIDADKPVSADCLNQLFTALLTELPLNPFFDRFKVQITPLILVGINAWHDANALERGSDNDKAIAYVLRDWYTELIMFIMCITRGYTTMREHSLEIRRFFSQHESLAAYMEKLQ
jgi:hypothetical protein